MAIVEMQRVFLAGRAGHKPAALKGLQELGIVEIEGTGAVAGGETPAARSRAAKAYAFLKRTSPIRRQVQDDRQLDVDDLVERVLAIRRRKALLEAEADELKARIAQLAPWGDFHFPPLAETGGLRLWFYIVEGHRLPQLARCPHPWACVHRDHRNGYVVVLAADEPDLPFPRTHAGDRSLGELRQRLEEVETELEDLHFQRVGLTRWLTLFARHLAEAEDREVLHRVMASVPEEDGVFAFQGWCPLPAMGRLEAFARRHGLALVRRPPRAGEQVPVLLDDTPPWRAGNDLVRFYAVPAYHLWDPSRPMLLSFVLFFAMIVGDGGYGLLLGLLVLAGRKRLSAPGARVLAGALAAATVAWGGLTGTWFGHHPPAGSLLGRLAVVDADDQGLLMTVSVLVGVGHLAAANGGRLALSRVRPAALGPLGWILVLAGCTLAWLVPPAGGGVPAGGWLAATGLAMVFLSGVVQPLTGENGQPPATGKRFRRGAVRAARRLAGGLLALTGVPKAFGDTLSYLRLFALGLATAKLGATFNQMAAEVFSQLAGMGLLAAVLILLLGHSLNLVLAVVSGVVHGLRLNFIEFCNWAVPEEGRPFTPLQRRRITVWNQL